MRTYERVSAPHGTLALSAVRKLDKRSAPPRRGILRIISARVVSDLIVRCAAPRYSTSHIGESGLAPAPAPISSRTSIAASATGTTRVKMLATFNGGDAGRSTVNGGPRFCVVGGTDAYHVVPVVR